MKQIDEPRLESDLEYRYEFLADFIGFTEEDVAAIHASAAFLAVRIPSLVEKTYEKLLAYDATARHFVVRQHGYDGPVPESLESISADDEQMKFRKEHLSRYLMQLIGHAYNAKMVSYLDMVGKMHTPKAGNKEIDVPLVQMNALIGLLAEILVSDIMSLDLDRDVAFKTSRAFNKLLWIQNDFVNRHYQETTANG